MESKTIYFENTGAENTEATLQVVRRRADELHPDAWSRRIGIGHRRVWQADKVDSAARSGD